MSRFHCCTISPPQCYKTYLFYSNFTRDFRQKRRCIYKIHCGLPSGKFHAIFFQWNSNEKFLYESLARCEPKKSTIYTHRTTIRIWKLNLWTSEKFLFNLFWKVDEKKLHDNWTWLKIKFRFNFFYLIKFGHINHYDFSINFRYFPLLLSCLLWKKLFLYNPKMGTI